MEIHNVKRYKDLILNNFLLSHGFNTLDNDSLFSSLFSSEI